MRKIVVYEFLTLDGVMESPETWELPYHSDDVTEAVRQQITGVEAYLYGRVTYEIFSGFWPTQTHNEFGFADHLNAAPKYVVSSTLKKATWNTAVIGGDAAAGVAKLKQGDGGAIGVTGSCTLVQALLKAGLVDELSLLVSPVVLGHGMRLFRDPLEKTPLRLAESRTYSSGTIGLTYQRAEA